MTKVTALDLYNKVVKVIEEKELYFNKTDRFQFDTWEEAGKEIAYTISKITKTKNPTSFSLAWKDDEEGDMIDIYEGDNVFTILKRMMFKIMIKDMDLRALKLLKTNELFESMKEKGYNVRLLCAYDSNYNYDYSYPIILIKTSDISQEELFENTRDFGEAVLKKVTNHDNGEVYYAYEIRRNYKEAELIEQEGVNYDVLKRREKFNYDTQLKL